MDLQVIADEINQCLKNYSLSYLPTFNKDDLIIGDQIISSNSRSNKLTDIIIDNYIFKDPISEYHHFTDIDSFENIIKEEELWLFSVEKRFHQDEFEPFYKAHNMDGYSKRKNNQGVPMQKDLIKNAFYISFTGDKLSRNIEEYMWMNFAKKNGVRLVFEVSDLKTSLRQIHYPTSNTRSDMPLLTDLINIAAKRDKKMIIPGIATIGFFYLPHKYNIEQEYRLLVKRKQAVDCNMIFGQKNNFEFLKFPINKQNSIGSLNLKKIIVNSDSEITKIESILKLSNTFKNTIIVKVSN